MFAHTDCWTAYARTPVKASIWLEKVASAVALKVSKMDSISMFRLLSLSQAPGQALILVHRDIPADAVLAVHQIDVKWTTVEPFRARYFLNSYVKQWLRCGFTPRFHRYLHRYFAHLALLEAQMSSPFHSQNRKETRANARDRLTPPPLSKLDSPLMRPRAMSRAIL